MSDPAKTATNEQKKAAFEWLRRISLKDVEGEDSFHAAVMMYENVRLHKELESSQWVSVEDEPPPENLPLQGFSPEWVDEDFNPEGRREFFVDGTGEHVSAKWFDHQDCYVTDRKTKATKWMPLPPKPQEGE